MILDIANNDGNAKSIIENAKTEIAMFSEAYLHRSGWQLTQKNPAHLLLWEKKIGEVTYQCNELSAIEIQTCLDAISALNDSVQKTEAEEESAREFIYSEIDRTSKFPIDNSQIDISDALNEYPTWNAEDDPKNQREARLLYFDQAENAWMLAPDEVDLIIDANNHFISDGEQQEVRFQRQDMTEYEIESMPEAF